MYRFKTISEFEKERVAMGGSFWQDPDYDLIWVTQMNFLAGNPIENYLNEIEINKLLHGDKSYYKAFDERIYIITPGMIKSIKNEIILKRCSKKGRL